MSLQRFFGLLGYFSFWILNVALILWMAAAWLAWIKCSGELTESVLLFQRFQVAVSFIVVLLALRIASKLE